MLNSDVQSSKLTKTSYSRILASSESWYCQVELKGKPMWLRVWRHHQKDHLGQWIKGFYGSCGYTTNIHAELHAILHGLQLASLGVRVQFSHLREWFNNFLATQGSSSSTVFEVLDSCPAVLKHLLLMLFLLDCIMFSMLFLFSTNKKNVLEGVCD